MILKTEVGSKDGNTMKLLRTESGDSHQEVDGFSATGRSFTESAGDSHTTAGLCSTSLNYATCI